MQERKKIGDIIPQLASDTRESEPSLRSAARTTEAAAGDRFRLLL